MLRGKFSEKKNHAFACFLDLVKAYDRLKSVKSWRELLRKLWNKWFISKKL